MTAMLLIWSTGDSTMMCAAYADWQKLSADKCSETCTWQKSWGKNIAGCPECFKFTHFSLLLLRRGFEMGSFQMRGGVMHCHASAAYDV